MRERERARGRCIVRYIGCRAQRERESERRDIEGERERPLHIVRYIG